MTESQVLEHEAVATETEAEFKAHLTAGNVCAAFEMVKPLLKLISNLWFLGAKTRERINLFIDAVDAQCVLLNQVKQNS